MRTHDQIRKAILERYLEADKTYICAGHSLAHYRQIVDLSDLPYRHRWETYSIEHIQNIHSALEEEVLTNLSSQDLRDYLHLWAFLIREQVQSQRVVVEVREDGRDDEAPKISTIGWD